MLKNKIEKYLEKQFKKYLNKEILPCFYEISKKSFQKNLYNLYTPRFYKRKYQLLRNDIWETNENNNIHNVYITENLQGQYFNTKKKMYLPTLIIKGYIIRKGEDNKKPRPIKEKLELDLRNNKKFQSILTKYE